MAKRCTEEVTEAGPVAVPVGGHARAPFVGRDTEMGQLRADVRDALRGQGRLVLVDGEPGIGKTSIARELAAHARTQGFQMLWGHCHEGGGAPAYWPWVQVIRSYVDDDELPEVAWPSGLAAADITSLVPELRGRLVDLPERRSLEPEEARFRLFDAVTTLLRNASKRRALVLILDDLHAADTPSLLLLQFFARQLAGARVLVLALYRHADVTRHHPLFHTLAELGREPTTRRLSLRGLREADVARYLELAAGFSAAPALVDEVVRRSAGNPFFIGEIVRLLAVHGGLDDSITIPPGVREAIGLRVDRLSAACGRTLRIAAVVGREFSIPILERVINLSPDELLEALEEAMTARVLSQVVGLPGRYAFVHGLFRETLYEELTGAERVQFHRKVGEALEDIYSAELGPHLAELAHHFFAAAQTGEVDRAIDFCIRAGERAGHSMAHEEAVRHYELALSALELGGIRDAGRLVDLLLTLADALWRAGEIDRAREVSRRAVDVARALGASEQLARAALGVAGWLPAFSAMDHDPSVIGLLKEALAGLPRGDSPLRAQVMARLAEALMLEESHEQRWSLSRDATEMARRLGDGRVLAAALKCAYFAAWDPAGAQGRVDVGSELVELGERLGDRTIALEGRIFRFYGFVELADAPAARRELRACERRAEELRRTYHLWLVAVLRGCLAFMEGRLGDVEELARRADAVAEVAHGHTQVFGGAQLGQVMWLQGRLEEVESYLVAIIGTYPALDFYCRAALAATYCERGREHEGRAEFDRLAGRDFTDIPAHLMWHGTVAYLSEACAYLDDSRRAEQLYRLLIPLDGQNVLIPATLAIGATSYFLGRLAATMGHFEQAAHHFESALMINARMGTGPWLARTQTAFAEMLVARGDFNDRRRALELLEGATVLAESLSMRRLAQRISELRRRASDEAQASDEDACVHHDHARRPINENVFRREGEYWTVGFEGRVLRLRHALGLEHLAQLLRHPGREFHAVDLASTASGQAGDLTVMDLGDGGSLLDPKARAAYQHRLCELRDALDEAMTSDDTARADAVRTELQFLTRELARGVGLGGRSRAAASPAERARINVTRTLKDALRRIAAEHPALGRHLDATVRTGMYCAYVPDPRISVVWKR